MNKYLLLTLFRCIAMMMRNDMQDEVKKLIDEAIENLELDINNDHEAQQ